MLHHNQLKLVLLPVTLIISVVLMLSLYTPKVSASSRDDCMTKVKRIDDLSKLKNKAVNPAVDKRLDKINELRQKAEKLPADHKAVIDNGLNADAEYLNQLKSGSARESDVKKLRSNYCDAVYKTQLYQFRARQIGYIRYVDARIKRDTTLQTILNHPYNTNVKSSLKSAIDERYNKARTMINMSVAAEKADANAIINAKTEGYTNNLVRPTFSSIDVDGTYKAAVIAYTEASALKKAASSYSRDRSLSLVSIELKNRDGKPVTNKDKLKDITEAVVTVQVSGQNSTSTKTLKRADAVSVWKVTK